MQTSHDQNAEKAAPKGQPTFAPGSTIADRYDVDAIEPPRPYGEHYRVRDRQDGRTISLVLLWPELTADPRTAETLEQKVNEVRGLVHKNLAQPALIAHVDVAGVPRTYVTFEHVDGTSLRQMIEHRRGSGRPIAHKTVYNVAAHLCNALAFAHTVGPHGALTADAVRVNGTGRVKLLDFGLGHLAARLGLQKELAPETQAGSPPSKTSDVWSVGNLIYQLLTGETPGATPRGAAQKGGVPAAVDGVIERAMSHTPKARYADAMQLKEALATAFGGAEHPAMTEESKVVPGAPLGIASKPPATPPQPQPAAKPTTPTPPASTTTPKPAPPRLTKTTPTSQPQANAADSARASRSLDHAMIDENEVRFMVSKDKMDFGPFSLRDIITQIESGKIRGDHTLLDTHTDERIRVREHQRLRSVVQTAETQLAEQERQKSEDAERSQQRRRVVMLLGALVGVIGLGAGGTVYYMATRKPVVEKQVIEKDPEMKWDVSLKVDPPEKKKKSPKVGGKPGEFDETTNLGDASQEGGDETLDGPTVQRVMSANYKVLVGCINDERKRNPTMKTIDMDFIIRGNGNVSAVKVNGQTAGAMPECMYAKMQTVSFPKFNGSKTHASFSLNLK